MTRKRRLVSRLSVILSLLGEGQGLVWVSSTFFLVFFFLGFFSLSFAFPHEKEWEKMKKESKLTVVDLLVSLGKSYI